MVKIARAVPGMGMEMQVTSSLEPLGKTPEGRLRAAIVRAELARPDAGSPPAAGATPGASTKDTEQVLESIDKLIAESPPESPLRTDAGVVRAILMGEKPSDEAAKQLTANHGWFGSLALAYPPDAPTREKVVGGGMALLLLVSLGFLVAGVAIFAGFVLLVIHIIARAQGRWVDHFTPPAPGGSVTIELVAVFVAGFLLLKAFSSLVLAVSNEQVALYATLAAQWLLLLVVFWPTFRGVPLAQTFRMLGLHRGKGIAREIGAGLVGYLACLPILVAGALVSVALFAIWTMLQQRSGQPAPQTPQNPVLEMASSNNIIVIVMIGLLASLWAPLAEELVFRGALYRFLRQRWPIVAAAITTGLGFGLMHGYPLMLLGPVIALGVGFSLMREWRDSLIGPMVAHCLHNATVLLFIITLTRLAG